MSESLDLTITPESVDGVTILTVRGAADVYAIDRLRDATRAAVSAGPVVIDLEKCLFLDSTGIGVLYRAFREAEKAEHAMALVATTVPVLNALRTTGLDRKVDVYGSQDDAVAAVREVPVGDPIAEIRMAARHMRERAGAMDAEMERVPWRLGYAGAVAAALGGPEGAMAAPWDQETVRAVADLLEACADQAEQSGTWLPDALRPGPVAVARAYLKGDGQ